MMKFFTRLFKSTMCSGCILGVIAIFTTSSSLADNCGQSDRVPLPACARVGYSGGNTGVGVTNDCDFPMTLKVDQAGRSDVLREIKAHLLLGGGNRIPKRYKSELLSKIWSLQLMVVMGSGLHS